MYVPGMGPRKKEILNKELNIHTFRDLLEYYPYKYVDRSHVYTIREMTADMPFLQVKGRILSFEEFDMGPKRKRVVAHFSDGTGVCDIVWFNKAQYIYKTYQLHTEYIVFGRPTVYNGRFQFAHPDIDPATELQLSQMGMQPYYMTTEKMKKANLSSRTIEKTVKALLARLSQPLAETLPPYITEPLHLVSYDTAMRNVHYPKTHLDMQKARQRLKFEELFYVQLNILRYASDHRRKYRGYVFAHVGDIFNTFYQDHLPFPLTDAQKRVMREIRIDLGSGRQMNRLLQGDVGSGKTIVAALVALLAIDNGFQACIMAPTEILAEQHYRGLCDQMQQIGVNVALLTGNVKGKQRRETLEGIKEGSISILVGTHALIEPNVEFRNLGLAVIDEQHRFGVKQRAQLWTTNSRPPHILVMTATPIPRTLAMTVYGDLDVSVIDQLPPGRKPIATRHYASREYERIRQGVEAELRRGRQVYIVYPLIKENEKLDLKALEEGYEETQRRFPQWKVGMVHGKMKPAEKDAAMKAFAANETQILVSTTVIEVGVNVPNASVMIVENAERFGLAQLHQLRGRVGRGAEQSYCILVTKDQLAENTHERMQILVETNDGFRIAEADLKFRGPGDLEGTAQSGLPIQLKMASLVGDSVMMSEAREAAARIIEADPGEQLPQYRVLWTRLRQLKANQTNYSDIS